MLRKRSHDQIQNSSQNPDEPNLNDQNPSSPVNPSPNKDKDNEEPPVKKQKSDSDRSSPDIVEQNEQDEGQDILPPEQNQNPRDEENNDEINNQTDSSNEDLDEWFKKLMEDLNSSNSTSSSSSNTNSDDSDSDSDSDSNTPDEISLGSSDTSSDDKKDNSSNSSSDEDYDPKTYNHNPKNRPRPIIIMDLFRLLGKPPQFPPPPFPPRSNSDPSLFGKDSDSDDDDGTGLGPILPSRLRSGNSGTRVPVRRKRKRSDPLPPPIKKTKVDITTQIRTLDDLINLPDKYEDRPDLEYTFDMKKVKALQGPLKELRNMVGLDVIKDQLVDQIMFLLCDLKDPDQNLHTVITGSPGCGKCLGKDTPILMYDGNIKMVQDVKVGDLLMGDDSNSRKVLSTCFGKEEMFKISQVNGMDYLANRSHILSLKLSKSPRIQDCEKIGRYTVTWFDYYGQHNKVFSYNMKDEDLTYQQAKEFCKTLPSKGLIIDISIDEYLKRTNTWKAAFKGFKVGFEYPHNKVKLDPYLLGYWLGDGTSRNSNLSTLDQEPIEYCKQIFPELFYKRIGDNVTYAITSGGKHKDPNKNMFLNYLKHYEVLNNKHIPSDYLMNSRDVRLQLLAGLLDSDGYLNSNCFEIIQKRQQLANEIKFLARSLGFSSETVECKKSCIYKGEKKTGIYYRTYISGNTDEIPTKISRKQATKRMQIKDHLVTGITLESMGQGNYYGFELDGNGRFLLEDFTVTHNTSLSLILSKIYQALGFSNDKYRMVKRSDLVGMYLGHTAQKTQRVIDSVKGGVLFIDEAYSLGNPEGRDSFSKEAIDTINQNLSEEKNNFICIIAGYKDALEKCFFAYNPGLTRRFPFRYDIDNYSTLQLKEIFIRRLQASGWSCDDVPDEFFTKLERFFVNQGGDMEILSQMSKIAYTRRIFGKHQEKTKHLSLNDIIEGFNLFLKNGEVRSRMTNNGANPADGFYDRPIHRPPK